MANDRPTFAYYEEAHRTGESGYYGRIAAIVEDVCNGEQQIRHAAKDGELPFNEVMALRKEAVKQVILASIGYLTE